jgi:hypothetical protein
MVVDGDVEQCPYHLPLIGITRAGQPCHVAPLATTSPGMTSVCSSSLAPAETKEWFITRVPDRSVEFFWISIVASSK